MAARTRKTALGSDRGQRGKWRHDPPGRGGSGSSEWRHDPPGRGMRTRLNPLDSVVAPTTSTREKRRARGVNMERLTAGRESHRRRASRALTEFTLKAFNSIFFSHEIICKPTHSVEPKFSHLTAWSKRDGVGRSGTEWDRVEQGRTGRESLY